MLLHTSLLSDGSNKQSCAPMRESNEERAQPDRWRCKEEPRENEATAIKWRNSKELKKYERNCLSKRNCNLENSIINSKSWREIQKLVKLIKRFLPTNSAKTSRISSGNSNFLLSTLPLFEAEMQSIGLIFSIINKQIKHDIF